MALHRSQSALATATLVLLTTLGFGQEQSVGEVQTIRVASISFRPIKLDLEGNAQRLEAWYRRAAAGGAQLAVAPEGILEGYIVNEILKGEIPPEKMREMAIAIDSPMIGRFQKLAAELKICLVFGFAEKINEDVFNCAVFIDHDGSICGKYHKMQLAEGYQDAWWFNRLGKRSRAFDTPLGRCGVLICNDRWNPLLAKIPALDGAQFLVIPSFGTTHTSQDEAVLARGVENGLPIVEANVGVSLIVNDDKIATVDRHEAGITFSEIEIPATRSVTPSQRDAVEAEFLAWRDDEMPKRWRAFVARNDPRGKADKEDRVFVESSELKAVIGNNRSCDLDGTPHAAGYNGLFSLTSTHQADSPFVVRYAGLNLEHYFDAKKRPERAEFFEPRYAHTVVRHLKPQTVELYQPRTRRFEVESWSRFQLNDPNYIDFTFRCRPHRSDYAGGFLGVFWASYINAPIDKSIYFLDGDSTLEKPLWRQLCTQGHNRDSTVRSGDCGVELNIPFEDALFANESPLRYATGLPFFYGRFREMVLIYVFQPNENIRFTHSPSGGGMTSKGDDTNPAWDFQLIIPKPEVGKEYSLEGRLIYKPWVDRADVLDEVRRYLGR